MKEIGTMQTIIKQTRTIYGSTIWERLLFVALVCMIMTMSVAAVGVGGEGARTYWKAPANTHSVGVGMEFLSGNANGFNPALPIQGVEMDTTAFVLDTVSYFDLFGRRNQFTLMLSYGSVDATTTGHSLLEPDVSPKGRADPVMFWNINLLGAPAQTLQEYSQWEQRTIIDAQLSVIAPLGSYDTKQLFNTGTNRWTFRVAFPFVQSIGEFVPGKRTTIEFVPSVSFFTDNTEAQRDTVTLAQDPLYKLEAHVTRDITKDLWVSLDGLYQHGGETSLDGVEQDNSQSSLALGFSVAFAISPKVSFTSSWQNTLTDEEDGLNVNMVWFGLNYHWNTTVKRQKLHPSE